MCLLWKVELEDGITSLGVNFILEDCYINQNAQACSLITRNADYSINNIVDAQLNLSKFTAEGVDVEMRWSRDTSLGMFSASMIWTHLLERNQVQFDGAPENELAGLFAGASFPEDKANVSLRWVKDDWSVAYLGEYISKLENDATFIPSYIQTVDSQFYSDVTVNYAFESVKITAGISNVTDEAPPYIDGGFNATTDPSTYRMFGRGYFLRLNWSY